MVDDTDKYLRDLASGDPAVRDKATHELWGLWHKQAGQRAEERLMDGVRLIETRSLDKAEKLFLNLVADYPDFPEGHNKLATVFYLNGKFIDSIKECRSSLTLNPNHFGAWNGLGMCLYNLGKYNEAIESFQKALQIQPHSTGNRHLIARCRGKLN